MTRTNKKGFTLIELIIVIAILAILVALLAPNLIKYIEKSRVSKDVSTLDGVYTAVKSALMDEDTAGYNTGDKFVTLSTINTWSDETGAKLKLYNELFGANGGSLTASDYIGTSPKVLKSNAASGSYIGVSITTEGKIYVAALKDGKVVKYNGDEVAAFDATIVTEPSTTVADLTAPV